jgi:hypothetical protein
VGKGIDVGSAWAVLQGVLYSQIPAHGAIDPPRIVGEFVNAVGIGAQGQNHYGCAQRGSYQGDHSHNQSQRQPIANTKTTAAQINWIIAALHHAFEFIATY